MFRNEHPLISLPRQICSRLPLRSSAAVIETHDPNWVTKVFSSLNGGDDCELLKGSLSQWKFPSPIFWFNTSFVYTDITKVNLHSFCSSKARENLKIVNESRHEGDKIRCFVGEVSRFEFRLELPISEKLVGKTAQLLRNWVALDAGSDFCPISYHLPTTPGSESSLFGTNQSITGGLRELKQVCLILVREKDLSWMYTEECNRNAIFPDPVLQNLTRFVIQNGSNVPELREAFNSILKQQDASRAIIIAQMIQINDQISLHHVCEELLKAPKRMRKILPFLIRRWEHQCSFSELPGTERLMSQLRKYLERFCGAISHGDSDLFDCFNHSDEKLALMKLAAIKNVQIDSFTGWDPSILFEITRSHLANPDVEVLVKEIVTQSRGDNSLLTISFLISSYVEPKAITLRIMLIGVLVDLVSSFTTEKFWSYWLGLLCVSHDVGDLDLIAKVCGLIVSEGSHQCHISCETLIQRNLVDRNSMWTAMEVFYSAREDYIRAQIESLQHLDQFDFRFPSPLLQEACGSEKEKIIQFLKSERKSLRLRGICKSYASLLMEELLWREPHWCRFDQPHEMCGIDTGFSVICSYEADKKRKAGGKVFIILKTEEYYSHQRKFAPLLEEELSWLMLQHNSKKRAKKTVNPTF